MNIDALNKKIDEVLNNFDSALEKSMMHTKKVESDYAKQKQEIKALTLKISELESATKSEIQKSDTDDSRSMIDKETSDYVDVSIQELKKFLRKS